MARQFFSGNTIEQALLAAARHYGLEPHQIAYKHRDKKHGFLNIRRRVVIEVDPAAPEQTAEAADLTAEQPTEIRRQGERAPEEKGAPRHSAVESWSGIELSARGAGLSEEEAFGKSLEEITEILKGGLEHTVTRAEDGAQIELDGEDSRYLRDEEGKALQAIEHLLPRLVRGFIGHGVPCRVDSGGFRAAREVKLRQLAESIASEVRRDFSERLLEPMTPADRRLVHLALAEDPTVQTESEGDGFLKRVRILPAE